MKMSYQVEQRARALAWNTQHRPGAEVSITLDSGAVMETRTITEAKLGDHGTAIVGVPGGAFRLERVRAGWDLDLPAAELNGRAVKREKGLQR